MVHLETSRSRRRISRHRVRLNRSHDERFISPEGNTEDAHLCRALIEYYNNATPNGKTNRAIRGSLNVFEWSLRGQKAPPLRGPFVPRPRNRHRRYQFRR